MLLGALDTEACLAAAVLVADRVALVKSEVDGSIRGDGNHKDKDNDAGTLPEILEV